MAEAETENNPRSIERLIFFSDAVVAIAITLLVLPLVEIAVDDVHKVTAAHFLVDNLPQFFAFGLSFVIIARLWIANHGLLLNTVVATRALTWITLFWVFTIVLLPVPTVVSALYDQTPAAELFYIGTGFVSTLLLAICANYLHRRPQLQKPGHPVDGTEVWGIGSICGAFLVAIAIDLVFPSVHYWSLLVLLLTGPLDAIVKPRIARREARKQA